MKKITLLTICFAIAILGGCQNIFTGKPNGQGRALPKGYGALQVSFAHGAARTAVPATSEFDGFDLEFSFTRTDDGTEELKKNEKFGNPSYTFILRTGDYTMLVRALEKGTLVAEGTAKITVEAGATINNVVTLHPIAYVTGNGNLIFILNHDNDDSIVIGAFTLSPVFDDKPPIKLDNNISKDVEYPFPVQAGYYLLSMTLVKTENQTCSLAGKSEVVHIYQNLDTKVIFDFTGYKFIENVVTNTRDYYTEEPPIPGSLRFALGNVPQNTPITIRVMLPPGSEIKLKEELELETGQYILEGNGIILSKSAEAWDDPGSRLMDIYGGNGKTIRRVHFKESDSGAISTGGTVTLESCIFSNSAAIYPDGAINIESGPLTVKACTFYDNKNGKDGWAISGTGNVNLTGNLFFGNNGSEAVAVQPATSGPAISSGGHNAVYLASTVDNMGSFDWMHIDQGDSVIAPAAPPFSPKTFRLFEGSEVVNSPIQQLPDGPPYPERDFYGNDITAPAYPGAVQEKIAGGVYLALDSGRGKVTVNPPSENFIYDNGTRVTLRAQTVAGLEFDHWLVNEEQRTGNPLILDMTQKYTVKAVYLLPPVTTLNDDGGSLANMTLRYALSIADNGDVIRFRAGLVEPGESEIGLARPLPTLTKNITVEGSGITLTPANSDLNESMMKIYSGNVKISRAHFKDGNVTLPENGGAITNKGTLTLESCIFSDNTAIALPYYSDCGKGGAIYNTGDLILKGCTFYRNTAADTGNAIYNEGSIALTGNLFYGNYALSYSVISNNAGTIASNGYNFVDEPSCPWIDTINDTNINSPALPFSPQNFQIVRIIRAK